ncbi:hypothetical protein GGR26_003458 [Lewinella marina]|uniref:DUF1573 domain-containing protein n=1 Tax=Neolewinella marina TaxID=438751 RepID=A0A2G0CCE3_9BACT|nr:DUF1573 domain-containing protein [Neolewinella marina]NJB87674.1 hypothetical protein [Neolewinella marina]PHK97643.1 hypothetical protein CGL56_14520 [Neolewinella marina]
MQRIFSLLLLLSGLSVGLQAQAPATEQSAAATAGMTFEQTEIDYGTIQQNADPYRTFTFTNTGNQPIIITNAVGSCGCTVPSYSKAPVAPGEKGEIKVRYATDRLGKFRKRVTLTTNVSNEPVVLTIMGEVLDKPAQPNAVPAGGGGMFNNGN